METSRRIDSWRALALALSLCWLAAPSAEATLRYGDIQIAGNFETQNLFRVPEVDQWALVQQRNTFRLQYEHDIVKNRVFLGGKKLDWLRELDLFAYYRFAYDSIYDIAPGGYLEANDGSRAGRIKDIPRGIRTDVATENVIREVYLDGETTFGLFFRIGRQQIVWGDSFNFRALDTVQALDLSWHLQQEAAGTGILGRVGFSEIRIPQWAIKFVYSIGRLGPVGSAYLEFWDIPFQFQPTKIRTLPFPWSSPNRDLFRQGLAIDAGEALGLPPGLALVQPCFDFTGSDAPNSEANPDFSETAETGKCHAAGLPTSSIWKGLYDNNDPTDVNQFGVRFGAIAPLSINFTLNYMYRRNHGVSIPGSTSAKVHTGAVNADLTGFLQLDPHETTDPADGTTSNTIGFLRIPLEFYYPYVHVFGFSANFFDQWVTSGVFNVELALNHGLPINSFGSPIGLRRADVVYGAVNIDRPTWIRFLNPKGTFTTILQMNFAWITDHEDIRFDSDGSPIDGDVFLPSSKLIPGLLGAETRTDKLKEFEFLTVLALSSFYKGGRVVPFFAFISDWSYAPTLAGIFSVDLLPRPDVIITPVARIFWTNGRTVDDRFSIGRLRRHDELGLKVTYQF